MLLFPRTPFILKLLFDIFNVLANILIWVPRGYLSKVDPIWSSRSDDTYTHTYFYEHYLTDFILFRTSKTEETFILNSSLNFLDHSSPPPIPLLPYPSSFLVASPTPPRPPPSATSLQTENNSSDDQQIPPSLPQRGSQISPSHSPTRSSPPPLFQRTVERRRPPPLPPKCTSSESDI